MTLAQAILFGDKAQVARVLTHVEDVNDFDEYGYTPLIEAAIINKRDIAELLLDKGAKVDLADLTGRTALYWAVDNNNVDLCKLLLDRGANSNAYTLASQPILVMPLLRNQTELKELLLQRGADLNFTKDYINIKLLAHRFMLQGVVDIVNHQGVFIELGYEGFFLEFTLAVLHDSLSRYLNHYSARHLRAYYNYLRPVAAALQCAAELVKYQQYTLDKTLFKQRIDQLLKQELLLMPMSYVGHAISFIRYRNWWIRCDRGEYGRQNGCINIYKVKKPEKLTTDFFYFLLYSKHDKKFVEQEIDRILQLELVTQLPIAPQVTGNCSWANIEASVPAMLFLLFQQFRRSNSNQDKKDALYIAHEWFSWDQEQALNECIHSFYLSSPARRASKAAVLGAILMQQCHYENFRDIKRAEKILNVLMWPQYKYILRSYYNAYCQPKITPAGRNFLNILEDCGIDPVQLEL